MNGCYYNDEIKVGDFIRTKTGNITKIVAIKDTLVWTDDFIDVHCRYNEGIVEKMDIVKHSSNIIDLIEVGDYVNGRIVKEIKEWKSSKEGFFRYAITTDYEIIRADEIKSIVTKEQFKSIEYTIHEREEKENE